MTAGSRTPMTVAVSTSDSPDMAALGLSEGHLKAMTAELFLQILAAGMNVAYGGDLRRGGYTRLLFELVARYTSTEDYRNAVRVRNYFPWPVHIETPVEKLQQSASELRGTAELVLVGDDGTPLTMEARSRLATREATLEEWKTGLTAMRRLQTSRTDVRVLLGGQVAGYKGRFPGIVEEALVSLDSGQPVFLLGGFGGCARDVAEALQLVEPWSGSRTAWPGRRKLKRWTARDLNNGLSLEENRTLASTPFIGEAVTLVLSGLYRLRARRLGFSDKER